MDASQIHLALNHFPLIVTFCGAALIAYAIIVRHLTILRVGIVFLVVATFTTIPTYLSGEGAEDIAESFPGVSEAYIHAHEESAELTIVLIGLQGIVSLTVLVLIRNKTEFPGLASIILILMSIFVFVAVGRTAHLGGQIRHQELRPGNALSSPAEETE